MHRLSRDQLYGRAAIFFVLMTNRLIVTAIPPSFPSALAVDSPGPHCAKAPEWSTSDFSANDCIAAADRFIYTDLARHGFTRYEFHTKASRPSTRFPDMVAPRRYTIGTCTVIIAMLSSVPDEPPFPPLPGDPSGPFQNNDIFSFREVFDALRRIGVACEETKSRGWEAVGQDRSAGVFLMATRSELSRNIPLGVEPSSTAVGILLNFTSAINASGSLTSWL